MKLSAVRQSSSFRVARQSVRQPASSVEFSVKSVCVCVCVCVCTICLCQSFVVERLHAGLLCFYIAVYTHKYLYKDAGGSLFSSITYLCMCSCVIFAMHACCSHFNVRNSIECKTISLSCPDTTQQKL